MKRRCAPPIVSAAGIALAAALCASAASAHLAAGARATELVVYVAPRTGSAGARLELVDRSGHALRVLSTAHYGTWGRWSPDDASIAWEDPAGIHVESADGSNPRLLVPVNEGCRRCAQLSFIWAPGSRALVVGSAGAGGNQLQLVPIDGRAPTVLVGSSDLRRVYTPAWWTPDGASLVYGESRSVAITGARMRMLTPATGKTVTLWRTPTSHGAVAPVISPDLRYRAYVTELDQYHQQLRIVDMRTGSSRAVESVNSTNLVGWSPDSKALGVVERGNRILTISPRGQILHRLGSGEQFFWGRDSHEVFIQRRSYTQVYASENGRPARLLFRLPRREWLVSLDSN